MASYYNLHPIQDDDTGLQGHQQNCIHLPPNTGQTTRPSMSTSLHYISWPTGTAITDSKQRLHSEVTAPLCSGATVVEKNS